MPFNLTRELGKYLQDPGSIAKVEGIKSRADSGATTEDNRPILQLNALPMTLSPQAYQNAHSSINRS